MPFRWHRSTTSLKPRATSLSFHLCYSGQDAGRHSIPEKKSCPSHYYGGRWCRLLSTRLVEESGGTRGRSSTRSLDDFGTAICFTVSMFSIWSKVSRVLSRRDAAADRAGHSGKSQGWNFDNNIPFEQPRGSFNGSMSSPGPSSRPESQK